MPRVLWTSAMPFADLEPDHAAGLRTICEAQMSGRYESRMTYRDGRGLIARSRLGDGEEMIDEHVTRDTLRALQSAGYVEIATPRKDWSVVATPKALENHQQSTM